MKIGVVTDSTCDLPEEIATQLGIRIVPMYINFNDESYLDGIDLSREAFYARLPDLKTPPTTAVPGPQMFLKAYEELAAAGATEILSVHISRELSAVVDTAQLAAREATVPVTIIDSGSLTLGLGFLAQAAAEAAAEGQTMDKIMTLLEGQRQRTHVFAVLDTLE
jgi:DegV family protein with EDD domain